jgi:peroxiredoxin
MQDVVDWYELDPVRLDVIQEVTKVENSCRFDQNVMDEVKNYLLSFMLVSKSTVVDRLQKFFDDRMSTFHLLSDKNFE